MIKQRAVKRCKGTVKTSGFESCNEIKEIFKYGLCFECYKLWLNTKEGQEYALKMIPKAKKQVEKERRESHRKEKQELNTSGAMRLADMYFSRYIRLKFSENGECSCYTCGNIIPIKEVDNGHYMKREHKATRYNENNCRPQDKTCNGDIKHNGKQIEFRENLVNEIGEVAVKEVEKLSKQEIKANTKFYRDVANEYRIKVNELQKELGIKYW